MYYFTTKSTPGFHQMTIEEFLFETYSPSDLIFDAQKSNTTNTKTYEVRSINTRMREFANVPRLIEILRKFNAMTEDIRGKPIRQMYYEFHIPKRSGGLRKIDAPKEELKAAQYALKSILENDFSASYHTNAFAYIKGRSTLDAVNRHIDNKSEWYGKLDLSNFFGSTTKEFVLQQLSMIYPFCEVMSCQDGKTELEKALSIAFLDGGLPQGTPISPLLTNIIMIPIDYTLSKGFRDLNGHRYIYTRYADDFIISSRHDFNIREIGDFVNSVLKQFNAPFRINNEKTRYGSAAGRNWCLGVMVTKDEEGDIYASIGRKKKKQFENMLYAFGVDTLAGNPWPLEDIKVMDGYRSYYKMIEGKTIDRVIAHTGSKLGVDLEKMIKDHLKL